MDIFYSTYSLSPLKKSNRLSSLDSKTGVYLKADLDGQKIFADYFPHIPLGDRHVDQFLAEFKYQNEEYDRKVLDLLLRDSVFQKQPGIKFKNHQLWSGSEPIEADIIKYKLMSFQDRNFLEPLSRGAKLRLDCNAMFTQDSFQEFVSSIPPEYLSQIEYVEDPLRDPDWMNLKIPSAQDFISAKNCDYYIYKPNCEFYPADTGAKIIFSAYLGSDLGNWHTYGEMVEKADFSYTHGIWAPGFYKEERGIFKGDYKNGISPDIYVVRNIYQELHIRNWKYLCTI